ncbi:MAG: alpha/beta hydrolase [Hahellaceae bacterium]|nr:alpha/beta hydrolase [Hahellaceae bacterium]MCP5169708.1 alpha/beta hydrolase [Hahellaceae bacterium]
MPHPLSQLNRLKERLENSTFNLIQNLGRMAARLSLESIELTPGRFVYYFDNHQHDRDTIVMLHGFEADKNHWLRMAAYLSDYRVIIPDLAGHGQTWFDPDVNYTIPYQSDFLFDFLKQIRVTEAHIIGNSMGGWVAASFAEHFPERVKTLTLLNSCGVASPTLSDYFTLLKNNKNLFFYRNKAEFEHLLSILLARPKQLFWPLKPVIYRHGLANRHRSKKIFADIINKEHTYFAPEQMMDARLSKIDKPTLIVWGDRDGIMHPSMADEFAKGIKGSETLMLAGIGHGPMLETPKTMARHFQAFLRRHGNAPT